MNIRALAAALFSVTAFLSAALLFVVQPMVSKTLLPVLGGAPAVWNTCLVFFQSALLLGYGYAYATAARLGGRRHVFAHVLFALLGFGALLLHARLDPAGVVSATEQPIAWILLQLALAVGLPFVVLSGTAPILQHWLAGSPHASGRDPYFLYAASNLGSLVALLSYPLLLEPHISLELQGRLWTAGYAAVIALISACGLSASRIGKAEASVRADERAPRIDARRRIRWIVLAVVPSAYLLGVSAFLSAEVAAVPLLWVVPLALYLLSFIIVFTPVPLVAHRRFARLLPVLTLLTILVSLSGMTLPLWLLLPLHLSTFFTAAVMCHGALAVDRPPVASLTEYYLLMSLGGALGGAVAALVAPVVFDRIVEYPLVMILACLMRPAETGDRRAARLELAWPVALGLLTAVLVLTAPRVNIVSEQARVAWMFGVPAIACYTLVARPLRFALGLAAFWLAAQLYPGPQGQPLLERRTFFGVLRVTTDASGRFHQLAHGNTIHGRQRRDGPLRNVPSSYYHPTGPAGDIFVHVRERRAPAAVAVVGLGAGSLCAYATAGEEWTFFELDAAVERIARDPAYFTFWRDCRAERRAVVIGDARLRLADSADGQYGLLVVDAFSSSAIPVHLITREALDLYRRKTAAGGWIVFHISSQHLDLKPILGGLARDIRWVAYARDDVGLTAEERDAGKDPSQWVILASTRATLGALAADTRWRPLRADSASPVWTDDFSNIWTVIKIE
jgi:hypothetical protein